MNKKLRAVLWMVGVVLVVIAVGFLAAQRLIGSDNNQRAAKSRTALVARFEKLTLPDLTRTTNPVDNGCNGLDFNDCAAVIYHTDDDTATLNAKLSESLTNQGFTLYKHDGQNRLDAFSNDSAMYLQFFLTGNNTVDVIVGEASNGQYAPS